jgi:hypothetical protein
MMSHPSENPICDRAAAGSAAPPAATYTAVNAFIGSDLPGPLLRLVLKAYDYKT